MSITKRGSVICDECGRFMGYKDEVAIREVAPAGGGYFPDEIHYHARGCPTNTPATRSDEEK